ncbi:MAG: tetratricopeptide repeat protein [Stellaceae bacterium]
MSDIFREIDEELRRENWAQLWHRFGKYIVALAVAIVVAAALAVGWRQYEAGQHAAEGVRYAAALDLARQGKDKEAEAAFNAVAQNSASGRAVLARFEEAGLKAKTGDRDGAEALYDTIAQDGSADATYRDLATLLAARLQVDKDPKAAVEALKPLTQPSNAYRATALELTAIAELKEGDAKAARATYRHLADDATVPSGARARAAEMVAALAP